MKRMLVTLALLVSAVSSGLSAATFSECEEDSGLERLSGSVCAAIEVDLSSDSNRNIELFVRKFPVSGKRLGSVWLIAGSPGESGATFYSLIDLYKRAFPNYDIIIPDHRGTGASTTICPQESPSSSAGTALAGEEWGTCFQHMYADIEFVRSFNITNAAHDLTYLISELGGDGEQIVYGVSYGTQLILRALSIGDTNISRVVLDSLVSQQGDDDFDLSRRSKLVNEVGLAVLRKTEGLTSKDSLSLEASLTALVDKFKNLKEFDDGLPQADLALVLGSALDVPEARDQLPVIIRGLENNDFLPLKNALESVRSHYEVLNEGFFNFGSSIPLVQVITSSENNLRTNLTKPDVVKEEHGLLFRSPLPTLMAENSMPTYSRDKYFAAVPLSIPETLVMHGTLDPKTSYQGAVEHVEALQKGGDIKLVSIENAPHFVALNDPECFVVAVTAFLNESADSINCDPEA